jgi:hypothetical protein
MVGNVWEHLDYHHGGLLASRVATRDTAKPPTGQPLSQQRIFWSNESSSARGRHSDLDKPKFLGHFGFQISPFSPIPKQEKPLPYCPLISVSDWVIFSSSSSFFFFNGTEVWTQGLHLEPLHQPFFVMGFFRDRVLQTICLGLASYCDRPDLCLLSS